MATRVEPAAKEVTGRILRLASLFQHDLGETFAPAGLIDGDYGVLVALRRAGAPRAGVRAGSA